MKKPSVLLVAVLALLAAESALAADLPLPGAVTQALPPLPTVAPVKVPQVRAPIVPAAPALPQIPGVTSTPAVSNVTGGVKLPAATGHSPGTAQGAATPAARAPSGRPSAASSADSGSAGAAGMTGRSSPQWLGPDARSYSAGPSRAAAADDGPSAAGLLRRAQPTRAPYVGAGSRGGRVGATSRTDAARRHAGGVAARRNGIR